MYFHRVMKYNLVKGPQWCRCLIVVGAMFAYANANAQLKHAHTSMLWFNYNNTVSLSNKWNWSNDFQFRTREWTKYLWQFAIRTGVQYSLSKKWTVSAGFAWFDNVRYYNNNPVFPNEWRPWIDIGYQVKPKNISIVQRIRFEERFLQKVQADKVLNEYETRERLRYRLEFTFPKISKFLELHVGNELMVNTNHLHDSLFFDQNRILFIANAKFSDASYFQFQYIKNFQLLARNYTLEDQDIFRFSFHQQLMWRRKKMIK